jgi:hypothetical protein
MIFLRHNSFHTITYGDHYDDIGKEEEERQGEEEGEEEAS